MRVSTPSRLMIGLVLGLVAGLLYGWIVRPVEYIDTTPASLRIDYRTDYVLMVAEAYNGDGDTDLALKRLAALGPERPLDMVLDAIDYGIEADFPRTDLESMNLLAIQLRDQLPSPEISGP